MNPAQCDRWFCDRAQLGRHGRRVHGGCGFLLFLLAATTVAGNIVDPASAQSDSDTIATIFRGVTARDQQVSGLQGTIHSRGLYSPLAEKQARNWVRGPDAEIATFGREDLQCLRFGFAGAKWLVQAIEPRSAGFDAWNICARHGLRNQAVPEGGQEWPGFEGPGGRQGWPRFVYASDGQKVSWWRWPSNRASVRDFAPDWEHKMVLSWIKRYLLLRILGKSAGEGLRDAFGHAVLAGEENIAGTECWKLVETHQGRGGPVQLTAWVAPEKGFAVLGWEDFAATEGRLYEGYRRTIQALEIAEVADGVWLPTKIVHHEYLYRTGLSNAWLFSRLAMFSDLRADQDIDWLSLASSPPLGAFVQDQRAESLARQMISYDAFMPSPLESQLEVPEYDRRKAEPLTGHEFD